MAASVLKGFAERDTCMRSLFIKVFLCFWLTVIIVAVALALSVVRTANRLQLQLLATAAVLLPEGAQVAAEEVEHLGPGVLAQYLYDVERRYPVSAFFFNDRGVELLLRHAPPDVRIAARDADETGLYMRGNIAAQRVAGPSGRQYSL